MRRLSGYIAASIVLHGILLGSLLYLVHTSEQGTPPAADLAFDIVRGAATPAPPPPEALPDQPLTRDEPRPVAPPDDVPLDAPSDLASRADQAEPARLPESAVDFRTHRPLTAFLGAPSRGISGVSGKGASPSGTGSAAGTGRAGQSARSGGSLLPGALLLPLAVAYESAAFYAAYQADNVPAVAAVAGLALAKGAVGHSVGKVARGLSGTRSDAADLGTLTPRHLDILCPLWKLGPLDSRRLYLALPEGWTYPDMEGMVDAMRKAHLVSRHGRGQSRLYAAAVDHGRVLKVLAARPDTSPMDLSRVAAIGSSRCRDSTDAPSISPR
jgi:hypothetical protein